MNLIMDCSQYSNIDRDSDLGDDSPISHDHNSEEHDDIRDCESVDGEGENLNSSATSGTSMDFAGDNRSPDPINADIALSQQGQFATNHHLGNLGNFMGIAGLHKLPNLPHGDVMEKLKMQVRDMNGMMDTDYIHNHFVASGLVPPTLNTSFTLPQNSLNSFGQSPQNLSQTHLQQMPTAHSQAQQQGLSQHQSAMSNNGFRFASPTPPSTKDGNPASNSSTSSEASATSNQNNGWSFEEQYKQVRQLYEINDDPKRKLFLDDLFGFMQKRGSPINRLPIMAKSVLDLFELYNLVIARGGLVDVINKKLWQEIIKGLHLPSSITSAAFTLRTQYMKYLYPYECEKKNLSTPAELQAAIDGNRREGRRSSYGQFEAMHNQLQMPQMQRNNGSIQQMSPLALVTHSNAAQAAVAAAHHRLMTPSFPQVPNLMPHDLEQRMIDYLKLVQANNTAERARSQSPDTVQREALNAFEMSRLVLWKMRHNNTTPPLSVNTSPQGIETQREALNLSESPPVGIKRERRLSEQISDDRDDFHHPPPAKRTMAPMFNLPDHRFHEDNEEDDAEEESLPNTSHCNENMTEYREKFHNLSARAFQDKSPQFSPSPQKTSPHQQNSSPSNNATFELPLFAGMQFRISQQTIGENGRQQLSVNLELNGVQYEGTLSASPITDRNLTPTGGAPTTKAETTPPKILIDDRTSPAVISS